MGEPATKADIESLGTRLEAFLTALTNQVAALPNQVAEAVQRGGGGRRKPNRVQQAGNNSFVPDFSQLKKVYSKQFKDTNINQQRDMRGEQIRVSKDENICDVIVNIPSSDKKESEEKETDQKNLRSSHDLCIKEDAPLSHETSKVEESITPELMLVIQKDFEETISDEQHGFDVTHDMPMKTKVFEEGEYVMVFFVKMGFSVGKDNQSHSSKYCSYKTYVVLYRDTSTRYKKLQPSNYGCPFQVEVVRYPEKNSRSSFSEVEESDAGAIFIFSCFIPLVLLLWFYDVFLLFLVFFLFLNFLIT